MTTDIMDISGDNSTAASIETLAYEGGSEIDVALKISISFLIIPINLVVLSVILSDKTLRSSPKYIHIINIIIVDLVYALVVLPFLVDVSLRKKWVHPCELRLFVDLFDISFHTAFSWFALSMLNLMILMTVCTSLFDKPSTRGLVALPFTVLPWILTCIGFIPLFRAVIEPLDIRGHPCVYHISTERFLALRIMTYPVTGLFLVLTSFLTITMALYRRNVSCCGGELPSRGDTRVPRGDPEDERREFICDVILASLLTLLLTMPVYAVEAYFQFMNGSRICIYRDECDLYKLLSRAAYYLRLSRCVLVPLVWFLGRDFRYALSQLMKRKTLKDID